MSGKIIAVILVILLSGVVGCSQKTDGTSFPPTNPSTPNPAINETETPTSISELAPEPIPVTYGTLNILADDGSDTWKLIDASSGSVIEYTTLNYQGYEVFSISLSKIEITIRSGVRYNELYTMIVTSYFDRGVTLEYILTNGILDVNPKEIDERLRINEPALLELYDVIHRLIIDMELSENMNLSSTSEGILVILKSEGIFSSGRIDIYSEVTDIAQFLFAVISQQRQNGNPVQVIVTGYTDDRPINNPQYPSNTSFSQAQASAFVEALLNENYEIYSSIFSVEGRGEANPIATNDTVEGRSQNRRIEMLFVVG